VEVARPVGLDEGQVLEVGGSTGLQPECTLDPENKRIKKTAFYN
jgi:hypothetical protein